jgi:hypothetical protein
MRKGRLEAKLLEEPFVLTGVISEWQVNMEKMW